MRISKPEFPGTHRHASLWGGLPRHWSSLTTSIPSALFGSHDLRLLHRLYGYQLKKESGDCASRLGRPPRFAGIGVGR